MSKWIINGKPFLEIPENSIGFIYRITSLIDGKWYIGQKSFYSNRTVKLSKKKSEELWSGKGRKPLKQKVQKISDWETYCSSSKEMQELINTFGENNFLFEILDFACSTSGLDYLEAKWILQTDALLDERNLNVWLSLKIRRNNICI